MGAGAVKRSEARVVGPFEHGLIFRPGKIVELNLKVERILIWNGADAGVELD